MDTIDQAKTKTLTLNHKDLHIKKIGGYKFHTYAFEKDTNTDDPKGYFISIFKDDKKFIASFGKSGEGSIYSSPCISILYALEDLKKVIRKAS